MESGSDQTGREPAIEGATAEEHAAGHKHPRDGGEKHKHKQKKDKDSSPLDAIKKWIGVAAAVLSLSSAIYGVLKFQAEKREQTRIVSERLATGHLQEEAKDYAGAWASFQQAAKASHGGALLVNLFGGMSAQQRQVTESQEDLAMEWVRKAVVPEYSNDYAVITETVLDFLANEAANATGPRKADLLAHMGWAHFAKTISTPEVKHMDRNDVKIDDALILYREAVAVDPTNPYANVFWGSSILQGPWGNELDRVDEAVKHFAAAVSTPRERATVRRFQLAALGRFYNSDKAWWGAVYAMVKAKEPLEEYKAWILNHYAERIDGDESVPLGDRLKAAFAALPPADHVEILRGILQGTDPASWVGITTQVALALALDGSGQPDASLAMWREAQESNRRYMINNPLPDSDPAHGVTITDSAHKLSKHLDEEIKRLTAGGAKQG